MEIHIFNNTGNVYMCPKCFKTYNFNINDAIKIKPVDVDIPEEYKTFYSECDPFIQINSCVYAPCCSREEFDEWVELFPIDPEMVECVRNFNKAGYVTTSCCQGHYCDIFHMYMPYVVFDRKLHTAQIAKLRRYAHSSSYKTADLDITFSVRELRRNTYQLIARYGGNSIVDVSQYKTYQISRVNTYREIAVKIMTKISLMILQNNSG